MSIKAKAIATVKLNTLGYIRIDSIHPEAAVSAREFLMPYCVQSESIGNLCSDIKKDDLLIPTYGHFRISPCYDWQEVLKGLEELLAGFTDQSEDSEA